VRPISALPNGMARITNTAPVAIVTPTPAAFDDVLALARFDNLVLKWSHPQRSFPPAVFPYPAWDPYLQAAVDGFGAQRIMWASDFTETLPGCTYAEALFYVRTSPVLSESDRTWILGRTARTILGWPKPD